MPGARARPVALAALACVAAVPRGFLRLEALLAELR